MFNMNRMNILWSFSSIEASISEIFAIKNCYFLALIFVERSEKLSVKTACDVSVGQVKKSGKLKTVFFESTWRRNWGLCLNHTVQKDSREVLGTSFRFGPTSEILENIQYGGSSVVKTDSQRSRFIAREAWFTVLLTKFAFIVTFAEFLDLYSKQSF